MLGLCLDLCQKLYCTVSLYGHRLDQRHIEAFQADSAMDVDLATTCSGFDRRVRALTHTAKSWFCLVFRVYGVSKIDSLIGGILVIKS